MCEKAAAAFQPGLKLVPDWFITNNMLDDLDNDVIINDEIDLEMMILIILHSFNHSPNNDTSSYYVIGLVSTNLKNINLDDEANDNDHCQAYCLFQDIQTT